MHILRNLSDYGVTSDKLREVAHDSKKMLQDGGLEILDEVFKVRKMEERFERNEVGTFMNLLKTSFFADEKLLQMHLPRSTSSTTTPAFTNAGEFAIHSMETGMKTSKVQRSPF